MRGARAARSPTAGALRAAAGVRPLGGGYAPPGTPVRQQRAAAVPDLPPDRRPGRRWQPACTHGAPLLLPMCLHALAARVARPGSCRCRVRAHLRDPHAPRACPPPRAPARPHAASSPPLRAPPPGARPRAQAARRRLRRERPLAGRGRWSRGCRRGLRAPPPAPGSAARGLKVATQGRTRGRIWGIGAQTRAPSRARSSRRTVATCPPRSGPPPPAPQAHPPTPRGPCRPARAQRYPPAPAPQAHPPATRGPCRGARTRRYPRPPAPQAAPSETRAGACEEGCGPQQGRRDGQGRGWPARLPAPRATATRTPQRSRPGAQGCCAAAACWPRSPRTSRAPPLRRRCCRRRGPQGAGSPPAPLPTPQPHPRSPCQSGPLTP